MKDKRNIHMLADFLQPHKVEMRFSLVQTVRRANRYCQRVYARAGDELFCRQRIGKETVCGIDIQVIFLTTETAKFGLDTGIKSVAEPDCLADFLDVLLKVILRSINHH